MIFKDASQEGEDRIRDNVEEMYTSESLVGIRDPDLSNCASYPTQGDIENNASQEKWPKPYRSRHL